MNYTHEQYMNGEVSRDEYFVALAIYCELRISDALVREARQALNAGDDHLNTIPLRRWDNLSLSMSPTTRQRIKDFDGEAWSVATGVCMYKALARHLARRSPRFYGDGATHCFYSSGKGIIDLINPLSGDKMLSWANDHSIRQIQERYPDAMIMDIDSAIRLNLYPRTD